MRRTLVGTVVPLVAVSAALLAPAPAQATVHEIVGQWCSGHDELAPPGITGGSNADNFARPLAANGVELGLVPGDPDGAGPLAAGLIITFDFDHPAVKVQPTGEYVAVGTAGPGGPTIYLPLIEPDSNFPAFKHCPRLAG